MDSWTRARQRRERRRRIIGSIVAIVAALALIMMTVMPSFAYAEHGFTTYHLEATAHDDGRIDVKIDLEFEFGSEESHGVYLTFPTRQRIENDPGNYRVLEYSNFNASSPTAPDEFEIETEDDGVGIYVGEPGTFVTGAHEYAITYTVDGVVNSGVGDRGEDEIYWNAIGTGFDVFLDDVRITLSAPSEATSVACWIGEFGSEETCESIDDGGTTLAFSQDVLLPGEGFTIAAAFEEGTFAGVEPILEKRHTFSNTMGGAKVAGIAGLGSVLLAILAPLGVSYARRDDQYEGYPPGQVPPEGGPEKIVKAPRKLNTAVQFTPPKGLAPADMGLILEAQSKPEFHAATIVDLAVRGFVHIHAEADGGKSSRWELTRVHNLEEGLSEYEARLLDTVFYKEGMVNLAGLPPKVRKEVQGLTEDQEAKMSEEEWFTAPPGKVKTRVLAIGLVLLGLGIAAVFSLLAIGYGLLGLPLIAAGIAVMFTTKWAMKRTAEGYAHYAQSLGFKKYLETAEANQLRFEAGQDIFSRYLPYAMVSGVVERWVAVFEELTDRGEWTAIPTWYTGTVVGAHMFSNPGEISVFRSNITGMQAAAGLTAMTVATAGSSGGSAFSSGGFGGGVGGGFSGGGVGGGGGGSW